MTGTYSPALVALSFLVAAAASYVAFGLVGRIASTRGWASAYWLAGGGVAMGTGIWSMHFIGMLAFHLPISMSYDVSLTVASLLIAVVVSGFALYVASRGTLHGRTLAVAGAIMGLGIAAMHYTGMAAMEVWPPIRYEPALFVASIVIAIAASILALALTFELRAEMIQGAIWKRLGGSLVMAAGIVGMHFTGMAAAHFAPDTICTAPSAQVHQTWLAVAVATSCFLFLGATMLVLTVDVRLAQQLDSAHARIAELARTDPLTGLANRRAFLERLDTEFHARNRRNESIALLYLDLDGFKLINDTLGHPMGDALLVQVAQRLAKTVRQSDFVARFGGDEFVILQMGMAEPPDSGILAAKIRDALGVRYSIDGHELHVTASIGVAQQCGDTSSPEDLMIQADLALYRAKNDGRNCYRFHNADLDRQVRSQATLAQELAVALERGELELLYQPQVRIRSRRTVGLETFVRWNHPSRGAISSSTFMPIAERTGAIVAIGEWMFDRACRDLEQWQRNGIAPPIVAVDLSSGQLKIALDLVSSFSTYLARRGVSAHCVEIELTEAVFMLAAQRHESTLDDLRRLGFRLAIEDFGTGYSSLSYLARSPVNRLKLARQVIADAVGNAHNAPLVRATIQLARELSIEVLAHGVDTGAQAEFLVSVGCDQAQGRLFGNPMSTVQVTQFLQTIATDSGEKPVPISKWSAV